ncbi:MAG: hypothetical protein R3D29_06120 [Nitratireductor sp.]
MTLQEITFIGTYTYAMADFTRPRRQFLMVARATDWVTKDRSRTAPPLFLLAGAVSAPRSF